MPSTEVSAYPWPSDVVFVAELDASGVIQRTNPALDAAAGEGLIGIAFAELLPSAQQASFTRLLAELGSDWERAAYAFHDPRGGVAEDRNLWLRRDPDGGIEVIAEPAWRERDRLVEQVLELNDDLIATQRALARRQRELERARREAANAARRVAALEAIVLAGVVPQEFDAALRALLETAQKMLPGDRADILLIDELGERLVIRSSAGPAASVALGGDSVALGEGLLGKVAARGTSMMFTDLAGTRPDLTAAGRASFIGAPLRLEGAVIGVLAVSAPHADAFAEPDLRLLEVVAERVALAIGQAQLRDREQSLVETLQRALLPQSLPDVPGLRLVASYRPLATSVGGDFYDVMALPDGTVGVAIGDVTGKGLRAAATMGRLRSALHAYALDSASPADVLTRLDRLAVADGVMATALYLVLDPVTGATRLSSAGHLPPLLIADHEAHYLDVSAALSPPLGWTPDVRREMTVTLDAGVSMVLFTDGLVERTHNIDEGLEALRRAAAETAATTLQHLGEDLLQRLAPAGRWRDDVALLALARD